MNKKRLLKVAAVVAASVGLIMWAAGSANAVNVDAARAPVYVTYPLKADSVGALQISRNSVGRDEMGPNERAKLDFGAADFPGYDRINPGTVTTTEVTSDVMLNTAIYDQASNVVIDKIGGPIATNGTVLADINVPVGVSRQYLVTLSGQIDRTTAAATPGKGTQPQLSLWWDKDNDGVFEWKSVADGGNDEGLISPNATIPDTKGRSVTVSGQYWLKTPTGTPGSNGRLKVIAFGYNNDTSADGGGELTVKNALLTLLPIWPHQ